MESFSAEEAAVNEAGSEAEATPGVTPDFVVGIGASAGGLESLEHFFDHLPSGSGLAFVVIQHLSPDFKSMMDELLARHTQLTIHGAEEGMAVEAGCIYLLPPKKEMIISGGLLHMADKDPKQLTLPIDCFFRSLANDCGSKAVGIILSGTGTDGSRGVREIHDSGGLVMCEDPDTAKFDGMPIAAQQTGVVDYILPAEKLAAAVVDATRSPDRALPQEDRHEGNDLEDLEGFEAIFDLLRRAHDIDFAHYKPTTVTRRIERRLPLVQVATLEEYVDLLRRDEQELDELYKDLLIGVTHFFRDADPYQQLEQVVIPNLLEKVPQGEEIRVWCAGCATGEEAYSIAILLHEALERAGRPLEAKIFATDVHRISLEHAGVGVYSRDRLEGVSQDRLERYFTQQKGGYRVAPELRQMIVFAQHNVIKDAPFTNVDLITCRNLLIYFKSAAQKKAVSLFHFGLKTGGVLLLGSSESPGELASEFETIDEHSKLFRKRRDIRLPPDVRLPLDTGALRRRSSESKLPRPVAVIGAEQASERLYDKLLDRFMPPSLLINAQRQLMESFGGAERLLRHRGRKPSQDVLDLLDTDAKTAIAGALNRVIQRGEGVSFSGVRLQLGDEEQAFSLSIEPIEDEQAKQTRYLITLLQIANDSPSAERTESEVDADQMSREQFTHMEKELQYTRENLQATIEELETSNEEMQAMNEELVASNEELQSTNEELHSVNEELYTVNGEHQRKIKELAELNHDVEHLLRSTDVGIIYLDESLCIRKFTPKIVESFHLIEQDLGRYIGAFAHRLQYDNLITDMEGVLTEGTPRETEVLDLDGRCYLMRLLPYRLNEKVAGVVLSLIDISILEEARGQISRLSALVESSRDAILSVDLDGKIVSWNAGAERLYGYPRKEAIGRHITMIASKADQQRSRDWLAAVRRGEHIGPIEVHRMSAEGKRVPVSLIVSPVYSPRGRVIGAASIGRDISQLLKARREAKHNSKRVRAIVESALDSIIALNEQGVVTMWNPQAVKMFGYATEEAVGKAISELIIPEDQHGAHFAGLERYLQTGDGPIIGKRVELVAKNKSQETFVVELSVVAQEVDDGIEFLGFVRDITDRRHAEQEIKRGIELRDQFLAMLSHELRNPLSAVRMGVSLLDSPNLTGEVELETRQTIQRQTNQMARLLDDLLDISRITQRKIRLKKSPTDLRRSARDAVESIRALATEDQITVDVALPDEPLTIDGDAARLQQIQNNLLTNAIKYSSAGQSVEIRLTREGDEAVIRVQDQGAGIAPDNLEQIFEMFVQSNVTLDRSHGGMGVGLTLVRELVDLHGGTVTARSAGLGAGSEFEVRLPLLKSPARERRPASETPPPHFPPAPPRKVEQVIVIEDQDDNRQMLSALLELEGLEVINAASGPEGIELIRREQPDAAIIDIGLPEIDGYEVARRIRAAEQRESGLPRMRLLALTGYGRPQDIEKALEAGFDHHLVKPLKLERLLAALNVPAKATSRKG